MAYACLQRRGYGSTGVVIAIGRQLGTLTKASARPLAVLQGLELELLAQKADMSPLVL